MSGHTIPTPSINHAIRQDTREHATTWGMAILDPIGDLVYEHDSDHPFPAASFNKLSTVLAWQRDGGRYGDTIRIEESDIRHIGNGILQFAPEGQKLEAGEVVNLALSVSDNTALRALVRVTGGPKKVNEILLDEDPRDGLDLRLTAFTLENYQDTAPEALFGHGTTSPLDSAHIFKYLLKTDPLAREALSRSNYNGGFRGAINSDRLYHAENKEYEQLRKAGNFEALRKFQFSRSPYPGKEGTIIDPEEHLRHHVVSINGLVISAMTTGPVRERLFQRVFQRGERHPTRKTQARIGKMLRNAAR